MGNQRESKADSAAAFFPKGALAFFVLMLASFGAIWFGMFLLLVHRQHGL